MSSTELTVIIPAYRAQGTLPRVLTALEAQVRDQPDVQVIVVDSGAEGSGSVPPQAFPWVKVVVRPQRVFPGAARNIGVAVGRGDWLAFLDADTIPSPGWLAELRAEAERSGAPAVAGSVGNGTHRSVLGTTCHLLDFSELSPHRRGLPLHGGSGNLLITRAAFQAAGGFPEDTLGEDTILTVPLSQSGQLAFAREALVWHLNRTGLRAVLAHEFALGRAFAVICERTNPPYRRFGRWPLLMLAPLLRYLSLVVRCARRPEDLRQVMRCTPALTLGLLAWAAGVALERVRLKAGSAQPKADSPRATHWRYRS